MANNEISTRSTQFYNQARAELTPLTAEEEAALVQKIKSGDSAALDLLVMHNIPLAESYALDLARSKHDYTHLDDLIQVAILGLASAAQRFNPDEGVRFSTFATPVIQRALYAEERKNEPVSFEEHFYFGVVSKIRQFTSAYQSTHGSNPSKQAVCDALNITPQQYQKAMFNMVSMDELAKNVITSKGITGDISVGEIIADDSADFVEELAIKDVVRDALSCLPERSREIISMRFGLGEYNETSSANIAELFGLSKRQINSIITDSLKKMERHLSRGEREDR